MPLYSYSCFACLEESEKLVSIDNRDNVLCQCGNKLQRQIDTPGLVWAPTAASGGHKT
jgi:putative FmdB family regulatory protein